MTDFANFFTQNMDRTDPNKKNSMYAQALEQLGPLGGLAGSTLAGQLMGGKGGGSGIGGIAESGMMGLLPKVIGGETINKVANLGGLGILGKFM